MEYRDIKKIADLIEQKDFTEFELETADCRLTIKRGGQHTFVGHPTTPVQMAAPAVPLGAEGAKEEEEEPGVQVKCPIVGTFYRSPAPDADSFVKVGSSVDEDTVVCIVEAMKVMNEIKAEVKGVVKKILVDNATPVEYGQPLFLIDPK